MGDWVNPIRLQIEVNHAVGHDRINQRGLSVQVLPPEIKFHNPGNCFLSLVKLCVCVKGASLMEEILYIKQLFSSLAEHQNHMGALKNPDAHITPRPVKSEYLERDPDINITKSSPGNSHVQPGLRMQGPLPKILQ